MEVRWQNNENKQRFWNFKISVGFFSWNPQDFLSVRNERAELQQLKISITRKWYSFCGWNWTLHILYQRSFPIQTILLFWKTAVWLHVPEILHCIWSLSLTNGLKWEVGNQITGSFKILHGLNCTVYPGIVECLWMKKKEHWIQI